MSEQIRTAVQADVPAMTALASIRREQYARYQLLFWRPAAAAPDKHCKLTCRMRIDGGIYADCKQQRNSGDEGRSRSCW